MRTRRGRARLISEYVDARIGRRPRQDAPLPPGTDADFDELLDLARELSHLEIEPPRGSEDAVLQRLARAAAQEAEPSTRSGWWASLFAREARAPLSVWQPLTTAALSLIVLLGVGWLSTLETPLSATDLLARVDRLDTLAGPGEALHRVVQTSFRSSPQQVTVQKTTVHEWLDASGTRTASQGLDGEGRVLWTEVNVTEGPQAGSRMYLRPGASRPGGLVVERPGTREFAEALARVPPETRPAIASILQRRRIVSEPIGSDRFENRVLIGVEPRDPRTEESVQVAPWTTPSGGRGYRVRVVDRLRPWIEWRGDGLAGIPATFERVRYVDARLYLTIRDTAEYRLPDGRVFAFDRDVLSTDRVPLDAAVERRFHLEVPPGTPVRRASADEELRALAEALRTPRPSTHTEENEQ